MNLTRRRICGVGALLIGPAYLSSLFGQGDKPRPSQPQPADQEFDMLFLRLRDRKTLGQSQTGLHERGQEFTSCLQRLLGAAAKLNEMVVRLPVSEVFSVQVYKEAELIEHLAKQLKRLAKG